MNPLVFCILPTFSHMGSAPRAIEYSLRPDSSTFEIIVVDDRSGSICDLGELARRHPEVVIIGTQSDFEDPATYFRRPFDWPLHAGNYVGQLNPRNTAALTSQCPALVPNDSGMTHNSAVASVPILAEVRIFSARRESLPDAKTFPNINGLPFDPSPRAKRFWDTDTPRTIPERVPFGEAPRR